MSEPTKTLAEILAEEEEDEMKWDYRLFTKREKRRFMQKRQIIQDNYKNNINRLSTKVFKTSYSLSILTISYIKTKKNPTTTPYI